MNTKLGTFENFWLLGSHINIWWLDLHAYSLLELRLNVMLFCLQLTQLAKKATCDITSGSWGQKTLNPMLKVD
jgi:hypothetical protein